MNNHSYVKESEFSSEVVEPRAADKVESACFISVIVPFFNSFTTLRLCLHALSTQSLSRDSYEIIAIDNGSAQEGVSPLRAEFPDVHWLQEAHVGSYAARNCGLRRARGAVIALTDADCQPHKNWLLEGLRALEQNEADLAGGRIVFEQPANRPLNSCELFEELFLGMADHEYLITKQKYAVTANLFARRNVFTSVGHFDDSLRSGGDRQWVQRAVAAGCKLVYAATAEVQHPRRSTFAEIKAKAVRIVGGQITLLKREPNTASRIAKNLYRQSIFNPRLHLYVLSIPNISGLGRRLCFAATVELMSIVALCEKIRILVGGTPRR